MQFLEKMKQLVLFIERNLEDKVIEFIMGQLRLHNGCHSWHMLCYYGPVD